MMRKLALLAGCLLLNTQAAGSEPAAATAFPAKVTEWPLPDGNAGAYAVAVDDTGIVWVNQIKSDTVTRFDPASATMQIIKLPVGIRKLTAEGNRVWYTGSHNGRLGVIK